MFHHFSVHFNNKWLTVSFRSKQPLSPHCPDTSNKPRHPDPFLHSTTVYILSLFPYFLLFPVTVLEDNILHHITVYMNSTGELGWLVTSLHPRWSSVRIPTRARGFLFSKSVSGGPYSVLFNGYWKSFLGIKRPGREVYHLPPSSAEVKNGWRDGSVFPKCLHGVDCGSLPFYHHCQLIIPVPQLLELYCTVFWVFGWIFLNISRVCGPTWISLCFLDNIFIH